MKKLMLALCAIVLVGVSTASAQLTTKETGPRNPDDLTRSVELFLGCESKVVSFSAAAGTTLITSGRGILCGVEMNPASDGGLFTGEAAIQFFDAASVSDVTLASTSLGNSSKIIADQLFLPFTSSHGGPVNNVFRHPVKFDKGIVIVNSADATLTCSMAIYWMK